MAPNDSAVLNAIAKATDLYKEMVRLNFPCLFFECFKLINYCLFTFIYVIILV